MVQSTFSKETEMNNSNSGSKGDYVSSAIRQGEEKVKRISADLEKTVKHGQEQIKAIVTEVDKKLHENPWPIVGGIAAASLLLGFILGSSKRH